MPSAMTWEPPTLPLTPDVIRAAADLIEQRGLGFDHPAYSTEGVSVWEALREACEAAGALYAHVEAVVLSTSVLIALAEPGVVTEDVVAELRRVAAAWLASPDGVAQAKEVTAAIRASVLTDGVEAWAREWAGEHTPDDTWMVRVVPGSHVSVSKGFAQSPHGELGYRTRRVDWGDLVTAAADGWDELGAVTARTAVRERLDVLVAAIETSTVTHLPIEPVGLTEIAARLGVKPQSAQNWITREVMPAPRWTVGNRAAWCWNLDIVPWARSTGRLPADEEIKL